MIFLGIKQDFRIILILKSCSLLFYPIFQPSGRRALFWSFTGFILQSSGPQCNDLITGLGCGLVFTNFRAFFRM
jgi:hypothetical protein